MIRVTRQGDSPSIPLYFLKELKLKEPKFLPFWDKKSERWLIVRSIPNVFRQDHEIEFCVSKGRDYTPLDRRTLFGISVILYVKNKMKRMDEHLKDLEDSDDVMAADALKAWQIAKKEFMKKLYRFEHTKTFT
jgi:hypothetical protein